MVPAKIVSTNKQTCSQINKIRDKISNSNSHSNKIIKHSGYVLFVMLVLLSNLMEHAKIA